MVVNSAHFISFGERKSAKSGTLILDQVDINKQWFYVEKGMVKVELPSKSGQDAIHYYKDAGQLIDENMMNCFCEGGATLHAVEDCDVYLLSRQAYNSIIDQN